MATLDVLKNGIEYTLFQLQGVDDFLVEIRTDEIDVEAGLPLLPYPVNSIFELRTCVERPGILGEYHGGAMVLRLGPPDEGVSITPRDGLNAYEAALWIVIEGVPVFGYLGVAHVPPYEGGIIISECGKQNFPGVPVMVHDYHFTGDFVFDKLSDLTNTRVGHGWH